MGLVSLPEGSPDVIRHLGVGAGVKVLRKLHLLARDGLVEEDVAARELGHELCRGRGEDCVVVGVAVVAEPEAQELLVDVLGGLTGPEPVRTRDKDTGEGVV